MNISGDGFTTFQAKIKPDFQPNTILALKWFPLANNDNGCTDRGTKQDQYMCDVRLYSTEDTINSFITAIESNRNVSNSTYSPNIITIYDLNTQEHIFGADVDHTGSISATAIMNRRSQGSFKGFEVSLTLKAISPAFINWSPDNVLPELRYLDIGYSGDSEYTIVKKSSYDNTHYYEDCHDDYGVFTGTFTFTNDEMIQARRTVANIRGGKILMPTIYGVSKPWGRRSTSGKYCRILDFKDLGMYSLLDGHPRWKAQITLAEAF